MSSAAKRPAGWTATPSSAVAATLQAAEEAGLVAGRRRADPGRRVDRDRHGRDGDARTGRRDAARRRVRRGLSPFFAPMVLPNMAAGMTAIRDWREGPVLRHRLRLRQRRRTPSARRPRLIRRRRCRRHVRRRLRSAGHATGRRRLQRHGRALHPQRRSGRARAVPSTPTATASSSAEGGAVLVLESLGLTRWRAARRCSPNWSGTARPTTPTTWSSRRRAARAMPGRCASWLCRGGI